MSQKSQSLSDTRTITRPYSKLGRLCAMASARGGTLTLPAAVVRALGQTAGNLSQKFGSAHEHDGSNVQPDQLGAIVRVFENDGVRCEIAWFHLEFSLFEQHLAEANPSKSGPRTTQAPATSSADWQRRETTVLSDLVELRLPPPRPGNEIPDSHYVDVTLLFGTAYCDYDPEDGQAPRTVSLALRNARLAMGSESYRPIPGTMISERIEAAHFKRVAGGIEIVGPAPNGTLEGAPFGDEYLAVIAGTNSGDTVFPMTIAANRRSFVVMDPDAPSGQGDPSAQPDSKNAILNALIYKHLKKNDANRAVLATATMLRLRRGADPVS